MWNALFVVIGASLWATDTLFRHPLVHQISPLTIVYFEHVFATIVSLIWVLSTQKKNIWIGWKKLLSAAFVGVLGSAVATVLFTTSFQLMNPTVTILLQKLQPVMVIFLSNLFLGEKTSRAFWIWAGIAFTSAFLMSFPHGFHFGLVREASTLGCIFALLAAGLWAISTVVGKSLLKNTESSVLSFWRFAFGLCALYFLVQKTEQSRIEIPFIPGEPSVLRSLIYMALIPGFIGVSLYYKGLAKVQASSATLLELSFPLTAVFINSYFLGFHLNTVQLIAAGALLVSLVGVSLSSKSGR